MEDMQFKFDYEFYGVEKVDDFVKGILDMVVEYDHTHPGTRFDVIMEGPKGLGMYCATPMVDFDHFSDEGMDYLDLYENTVNRIWMWWCKTCWEWCDTLEDPSKLKYPDGTPMEPNWDMALYFVKKVYIKQR